MTNAPTIGFKRLQPQKNGDIPLPRYMTPQAAGMDICAANEIPLVLKPGERALVPTGWAMSLPSGFEAQIRPRSGLAIHHGITILNTPGTIDSDYRGEVQIALVNLGDRPYTIQRGERIAQMVIQRVFQVQVQVVTELDDTQRNDGGFGSTGLG